MRQGPILITTKATQCTYNRDCDPGSVGAMAIQASPIVCRGSYGQTQAFACGDSDNSEKELDLGCTVTVCQDPCVEKEKPKRLIPITKPCIPYKGPLTEYKDKYRRKNPLSFSMKSNWRPKATFIPIEHRPKWNSSNKVPCKPLYEESLSCAEAKLRMLEYSQFL